MFLTLLITISYASKQEFSDCVYYEPWNYMLCRTWNTLFIRISKRNVFILRWRIRTVLELVFLFVNKHYFSGPVLLLRNIVIFFLIFCCYLLYIFYIFVQSNEPTPSPLFYLALDSWIVTVVFSLNPAPGSILQSQNPRKN